MSTKTLPKGDAAYLQQLRDRIEEDPRGVIHAILFSCDNRLLGTDLWPQACELESQAREIVKNLPGMEGDFICDDHQEWASICGCLDEELRTHCTCGIELVSDGVNMVCPICEWPDPYPESDTMV